MSHADANAKQMTEFILQINNLFLSLKSEEIPPDVEFNFRELNALFYLGWNGPCMMRELADHLGLAVSTLTGVVDRMVQKELIVRERPEEDRRIVKVALTEKGRAVYEWHITSHMEVSREILKSLSETDQKSLLTLMQKIVEQMIAKVTQRRADRVES